jgi:aspartate/methionine/tyrosine aminotransferase
MIAAAPYMVWAKTRPRPRIDLAGSNLLACSLEDLPGARDAVDVAGESPEGHPTLVGLIARAYGVAPDGVATAVGCSGANFLAFAALLEADDEVLIETPYYDPLPAAVRMLGGRIASFARRFEDGFDLDPEIVAASLTRRTRLLVLTNPHNPSGVVISPDRMEAVARLAERRGFTVLVDEVYRDLVPGEGPAAAAALSEACVSTSSLTKAYGLASLRCGWALASSDMARRIRRARDVVDGWSPIPSDRLAALAFRNLEALRARSRALVEANLGRVTEWLAQAGALLECAAPRATLAFPRLRGVSDAGPFVERLFRETGVAVAPGHFFGAPAHFRIAFGGEPAAVAEGLEAIRRTLEA